MMNRRWINAAALCCLAGFPSLLDSAEMKTVPERPVWVADGATQYLVYVWVDNTGLAGQPTDGVQWRFLNTPALTYLDAAVPSVNDFFEGIPMFDDPEWVFPPGQLSMRMTRDVGAGPVDDTGNVAQYEFIVPAATSPGIYSFSFSDDILMSLDGDPQPHTVSHVPFTIVPNVQADFNKDGYVNLDDYAIFEPCLDGPGSPVPGGCDEADLSSNGTVDLKDYAGFQRCFTGDEPVSDAGCAE